MPKANTKAADLPTDQTKTPLPAFRQRGFSYFSLQTINRWSAMAHVKRSVVDNKVSAIVFRACCDQVLSHVFGHMNAVAAYMRYGHAGN